MKKSLSILIVIILIIAQACIVEDKYKESDIYSDFETEKGFSVFHLPPVLFKIVLSVSDEKEIASKDVIDKIDVIKILFFEEKDNTIKINDLESTIKSKIKEYDYQLLTKIANENNDISIHIIDIDKIIREVLITVSSENEYISVNLVGEFTRDDVMEVYKTIDMQNIRNYNN